MSDDKTGGPAFPTGFDMGNHLRIGGGMTLRDYFAAKAMQGMLTGCVGTVGNSQEFTAYAKGHCNSAVVDRAYVIADAMLAARKESK